MPSADELEAVCSKWLRDRAGQLTLQRTLYLIPGLDDEGAGCWSVNGAKTIYDHWGPLVFSNWHGVSSEKAGTPEWNAATVRLIQFPMPYPATFPGTDFRDFGLVVRQLIAMNYPDDGSLMGEYDVVGHSMGALDAMAALLPLNPASGDAGALALAKACNFVSMDAPYRGVPNMPIRRKFSPPFAQGQCSALTEGSAELALVDAQAAALSTRVTRMTCYGVETASQVEVRSANLYADRTRFEHQRFTTDYRFLKIPGSSHSGSLGITRSTITIANMFDTITRSDRLSELH